ncbi:MAG: hypothetical protein B7733_23590 [Myxococcales bacterium FL481]|nr:MAG: hypothetical protein B7733_23590 [Myxococcales bacterium FL481]
MRSRLGFSPREATGTPTDRDGKIAVGTVRTPLAALSSRVLTPATRRSRLPPSPGESGLALGFIAHEQARRPDIARHARRWALALLTVASPSACTGPRCGDDAPPIEAFEIADDYDAGPRLARPDRPEVPPEQAPPHAARARAPSRLAVRHRSDLARYRDYMDVEHLELGPGPLAVVRPDATDDALCGLPSPVELAQAMPRVRRIRLASCDALVLELVTTFAGTLLELELVDIQIDRRVAQALTTLPHLSALSLTRVQAPEVSVKALARQLALQRLTLRELERDTPLTDLISDSRQLVELELEGRWIRYSTMQAVSESRHLESLTVRDAAVGNYGLNLVKPLEKLRRLHWESGRFNDHSPLYLRHLPLERVICACPRLGDAGLRHFRLLANLRQLDLRQPNISLAGWEHLARLEHLEELRVTHAPVGGSMFTALAELAHLRRLRLERVELATPNIADLNRLAHLEVLEFDAPDFTDKHAQHLSNLTRLRELDLGGTRITDAGLRAVAGLVGLQTLRLHHTRVTNTGLAHVAGLTNLQVLELDHTDVVDEGVQHLAGLSGLRELRLDHTLVTDTGVEHLRSLHELERLNLAGTVVSEAAAPTLASLPKLVAIDLSGTRLHPTASTAPGAESPEVVAPAHVP